MDIKKQALVGYLLTDFIYTFPGRAYFKRASDYTYQLSNQQNVAFYGLTEEQIVGKTVFDLKDTLMKDRWPSGFVDSIHAADVKVVETKETVKLKDKVFQDKSGALLLHTITKLPVFNEQQKVIGILTLSFDAPKNSQPYKVKEAYTQFYKDQEANMRFMSHIGFCDGVTLKLTSREMDCLMSLIRFRTNKAASRDLNISVKTFDNHLCNIKEKCEANGYTKDLVGVLSSVLSGI